MGQTDSGVRRVDALTAVSGGTEHIKFTLVEIQVEINLLRFRQDSYGHGGSMDSSA